MYDRYLGLHVSQSANVNALMVGAVIRNCGNFLVHGRAHEF